MLFLSADLMFTSRVAASAKDLGAPCEVVSDVTALIEKAGDQGGSLVVIDLTLPGLDVEAVIERLRELAHPPGAIIAYGPHVHEARLAAAARAGCDEVFTRGTFSAQMPAILSRYLKPREVG